MPPDTELEIINRVKSGEINAFGTLIKRYEKRVYVFAENLLRTPHSVEDLVQEVFLAAYKNIHSFDPDLGKFSTWLMRIARNKCLNEIKKKKETPISNGHEMRGTENPEKDLIRKKIFLKLDDALNKLPFKNSIVFVLAEILGMSQKSIAEIERIRLGTVKSRLSRAKEKLRAVLREDLG
jgi:RNA polymerase sigma-70 factor (ECF subfamily)